MNAWIWNQNVNDVYLTTQLMSIWTFFLHTFRFFVVATTEDREAVNKRALETASLINDTNEQINNMED